MKKRAEKKIQIAIDKLIDLQDMCDSVINYQIGEALEKLRHIENEIINSGISNGKISTNA